MKKRFFAIAVALIMVTMTACTLAPQSATPASDSITTENASGTQTTTAEPAAEKLKVTYITTNAGLGDKSFNDSAWAGLQKAEKELGVEISVIEPKAVSDYGTALVSAVNSGSNIILGFSASWTDTFNEYCPKYPKVYFGGLNCNAQADNLMIAVTSDHEGSFLAGALAAMMSKTGTIGVIGGQDADNINRFIIGYEEGAKYVNPSIVVLKSYVGAFNDPAKGKEFALQLMNEGADVIYQLAGGSGMGVFEAAKENANLYAIGSDADQDYIVEGKILTSMIKNCGVIAYDIVKSVQDGTFVAGKKAINLASNGVCLSDMQYTKELIGAENLAALDEIRNKIISGEIVVTDLFSK